MQMRTSVYSLARSVYTPALIGPQAARPDDAERPTRETPSTSGDRAATVPRQNLIRAKYAEIARGEIVASRFGTSPYIENRACFLSTTLLRGA